MFKNTRPKSCGMASNSPVSGSKSCCMSNWKLGSTARALWKASLEYSSTKEFMLVVARSADPRPIISMSWTIRLARAVCDPIRSRLLEMSSEISWTSPRWYSLMLFPSSSRTSRNSVRSSLETSEKFFTKFSGFRISWATPAVSSPRAASFSRMTIWSCARFKSARVFSSSSFFPDSSSVRPSSSTFLPCNSPAKLSNSTFFPSNSWASSSTKFSRCTSRACWRNTSSAAAMSATSSRPPISTCTSRSPPAIRRIQSASICSRRSSTRPTNNHAISKAPPMLKAVIASSSMRPVNTACVEARVASWALACA